MAFTELVLAALACVAIDATVYLIKWIKDTYFTKPPVLQGDELTETDVELASQTADKIKEIVGDDPITAMGSMTSSEKIATVEEITKELIDLYELTDISYQMVSNSDRGMWGYYNHESKTLYINISNLLCDSLEIPEGKQDEYNRIFIRETLDTVVHELRHAIQFKAAFNLDEDYLDIDRDTRIEWAKNIANYIPSSVDPKKYAGQPIERDAVAFAHESMKGVFGDE